MISAHPKYPNLHVFTHPLIQDKLSRVRDVATDSSEFRRLTNQIASLMTFHVFSNLSTAPTEVTTPLEQTRGERIDQPVTLVPILRAGLGMTEGILALYPEARVGHIGMYRNEQTLRPVPYYCKLPPDVAQGPVLLVDPMVATGHSAEHAVSQIKQAGCRDVRLLCLVSAPSGVQTLLEKHPDVPVYTAALDRELSDVGYILPGLGDAGDRLFGTL